MPFVFTAVPKTTSFYRPDKYLAWVSGCWLAMSLCTAGFCAETDGAVVSESTLSAADLLTGATNSKSDFHTDFDFRLTQNTIQIDAQISGTATSSKFVLDSGAPMTIAPRLAREHDLGTLATVSLAGPESGRIVVPVTRIPEISIADVAFRNVGAVVDWAEPPDELACLSTAGLLGASLLQTAIWQIDFETRRIVVTSSLSTLPGLKNAIELPFIRADAAGSPRISVSVGDTDNVSLLVDLGFNGGIAIPTSLLEKAGNTIAASAPTEEGQATSTVLGDTPSTVRISRLSELRIGDLRLKDFPVVTGTEVSDFHVGIDFLRHFRVTIDWLHNTLYLEPRSPEAALYDDFATYGFKPQLRDGKLVVGALWRGSDVDKAGLEIGDRIVDIDGQDTSEPSFEAMCAILDAVGRFGANDAPLSVTRLRDGQRQVFRAARVPLLR
ncbi:MAG: aspartyl protease family protein [Halioglobus sp.]